MALNTTLAERRTAAANDLADKLKLERRAIIELREFFNQMGDTWGRSTRLLGAFRRRLSTRTTSRGSSQDNTAERHAHSPDNC